MNIGKKGIRICLKAACVGLSLLLATGASLAIARAPGKARPPPSSGQDGVAERHLLEVYRLAGNNQTRLALQKAGELANDHPNFQLAQLVYGDLLAARAKPRTAADVRDDAARPGVRSLQDLRAESDLRIASVRQRPPPGTIPSQFLSLARSNRHAIAVDVTRARLYLFENTGAAIRLVADYYISVGKLGVGKQQEGDQRTPLGLYFITSNLDRRRLIDLYGAGALPINYPNAFDVRQGRTGSGIWLHGTPSSQFSRAPLATDGCIAVANPDLERILSTVGIRRTPVLIARKLTWVSEQSLGPEKMAFEHVLQGWATARAGGDLAALKDYYAGDFNADGKDLAAYESSLRADLLRVNRRAVRLSEVSILGWADDDSVRVVTFGENLSGQKAGRTVRQYWQRRNGWKIVYEGVLN